MERSRAYKGLGATERAQKKQELDAQLQDRVTRLRKVRLFPTPRQHSWLLRWFKDARATYNLAMGRVLQHRIHTLHPTKVNLASLEKEFQMNLVTKIGVKQSLHPKHHKLLRTPKVLRQQAVKSAISVLKAHHTRVKKFEKFAEKHPLSRAAKRGPPPFRPGLKSRRLGAHDSFSCESVSLRVTADDAVSLYKNFMDKRKNYVFRHLRTHAGLHSLPTSATAQDFKVHFRHGKFFLLLPERRAPKVRRRNADAEAIGAIDPGVRVPFTVYSPEGSVLEIGATDENFKKSASHGRPLNTVLDKQLRRISRTKKRLANAVSRMTSERETCFLDRTRKSKQRAWVRKAKRAYHDAEDKAKRVMRDFHYKSAHFLLQRFTRLILPTTSSQYWRRGRRLLPVTKRRATLLRYGQFVERLVQTATQYPGSEIFRGSEAYTSKQCGCCGVLNNKLGASKTFTCPHCGLESDRDVHAARNILLRFLQ